MSNPKKKSFDEFSNHYSHLAQIEAKRQPQPFESLKSLMSDSYHFVIKYINHLSKVDQDMARLYYIDGLSQNQICALFGIVQAAVSRRLKIITKRIKFLIKMPSLNPIQVRQDIMTIFDPSLVEFAYHFYCGTCRTSRHPRSV